MGERGSSGIFSTRLALLFLLIVVIIYSVSCAGGSFLTRPPDPNPIAGGTPPPSSPPPQGPVSGVLMWKGDNSEKGLYSTETTLTPANVNVGQFGRLGSFKADGLLMAQLLYIAKLDMGQAGTHNVIILATEND